MKTTQRRAKTGGEYGANGEWYEGGKFINTVEENAKSHKPSYKATRKQQVEPYKWEVAPDGKLSLYAQLAGWRCSTDQRCNSLSIRISPATSRRPKQSQTARRRLRHLTTEKGGYELPLL